MRGVTRNPGRVLGVTARRLHGAMETYDQTRIDERCRILLLAIDARRQRFPHETPYVYKPLAGQEDANRFNETTRRTLLRNYNQRDMFI